ncbi:hypothetical protein HMPREF1548_00482 [Clostridium sp. KLE 1755]|nr:hypothetical protein HMPREF1548_00482 [Clostridium sp. KLE 1755]
MPPASTIIQISPERFPCRPECLPSNISYPSGIKSAVILPVPGPQIYHKKLIDIC